MSPFSHPLPPRAAVLAAAFAVFASGVCLADYRLPLMPQAPIIDGKIDAAEWSVAAGFEGFIKLGTGALETRRARGFVGATGDTIFVAIQTQLPDEGVLLAVIDGDSLKAVHDDSVEIYINPTPDAPDRVDYQFLANSMGKGGYNIHKLGSPAEEEAWRGDWRQAHGLHEGWWHFECAIPVSSMGLVTPGRRSTDGVWSVNLCRNWKPDWGWSSLSGAYPHSGPRFTFTTDPAPAVQVRCDGHPAFPPAKHVMSVRNPSDEPLTVNASLEMIRNNMPELRSAEALSLAPGEMKEIALSIPGNDPTTVFDLKARVASADGQVVYYEREVRWNRSPEPPRWVTQKPADAPPVDFRFAYYPTKNAMRIAVDINGLPRDAKLEAVRAVIRDRWTGKDVRVVDFPLPGFKDGRQEQRFDIPALEGEYEIAVSATGEDVPGGEMVKQFERTVFPWEGLPTGRSTRVYAPFTPLRVEGNRLQAVLREYDLNGLGLLDQVTGTSANTGVSAPILASPMRYTARVAGADAPVAAQPVRVVSAQDHEVITEGEFAAGALKANWRNVWEYDGCAKVELTLQPTAETVDALTLEIPFSAKSAPMIHANSDRIRAPIAQRIPEGEGVVWDGSKVACDEFIRNFCPYVYIGSAVRGLCWFAENDRNWGWDPKTPNMELVREGDRVILRIHIINTPTAIDKPRTITFGLLAAPVKPMLNVDAQDPNWWRYRYMRDRYTLLGTDINWFGNHSCGTVYPVGCDLYLWEMLARGNREQLSSEEINAVQEYGLKYWQGGSEETLETWRRHVQHNLRSRYNQNMVFYYNRAASQELPEFETFKDEWCLSDLRAIGKGKGRGEIKVVPSESYNDFCLYWYARSFEIGNNKGVYWDNYFIAPSFNTEMTEAYRRPDGSIAPAAGLWAMRDLVKRTFTMMNERGMTPITFPHMTSFNPLPLMSFATVQYEWEWKYSSGDVQDRFSREYIQLATTGELAGVWPVPLSDQGDQSDDPWVQRTFSAVRILHELDGYGGWGAGWVPAQKANRESLGRHIEEMLDKPGLVVYKYWEDRPQPAVTNDLDVPTIVYSVPGQEALIGVVSYAREDRDVILRLDPETLGLTGDLKAVNVETGEELAVNDSAISFPLAKHDIRLIRLTGGE